MDCMREVVRGGTASLYAGYVTALVRVLPLKGIMLGGYSVLKDAVKDPTTGEISTGRCNLPQISPQISPYASLSLRAGSHACGLAMPGTQVTPLLSRCGRRGARDHLPAPSGAHRPAAARARGR